MISIIIVNYNTTQLTNDCIESIFLHSTDVDFEIIVVDNSDSDDFKLYNSRSQVKVIRSTENIGFGRANNLGLSFAIGEYILLLNSDTIVLNNILRLFLDEILMTSDDIFGLSTFLVNEKYEPIHSLEKFPTVLGDISKRIESRIRIKKHIINIHQNNKILGYYATGAVLFLRKKVISKEGFFDPNFFLYYEETDLQKRFQNAGYKLKVVSGPQIVHMESVSSKTLGVNRLSLIRYESKLIYFQKWERKWILMLYKITSSLLFLVLEYCYPKRRNYFIDKRTILEKHFGKSIIRSSFQSTNSE